MKILYFANLKQLIGKSEETICIKQKKKISQVINELNCEYVDLNFVITDSDELAIFPPVSGG